MVAGLPLSIPYLDAGAGTGSDMSEMGYCYYFEDVIVAGVERAMEGENWTDTETPALERTTSLEALDVQISAITAERNSLVNDLVDSGLVG